MSTLHHMVPLFLLSEFGLVFAALVSAMLYAGPQYAIPIVSSSPRVRSGSTTASHD
ncbi:MAG: hypothetical protein ACLQVG_31560 [Terriglobia bacterium]